MEVFQTTEIYYSLHFAETVGSWRLIDTSRSFKSLIISMTTHAQTCELVNKAEKYLVYYKIERGIVLHSKNTSENPNNTIVFTANFIIE